MIEIQNIIRSNVLLSDCTTLRLGGPAEYFAEPSCEEEIRLLLAYAKENSLPVTVIGRGSNLLVRDGGLRGLVIRFGRSFSDIRVNGNTVSCEAGAALAQAAAAAMQAGLSGLEFASGIPGTVGGAVLMNAGAYGGEMCQAVTEVRAMTMDGAVKTYTGAEMAFGYRTSRLQRENAIVLGAQMTLTPGDPAEIREKMAELNRRRAEKQPLEYPSAGSTFKRPAGGYAAALIEGCGLKGYTLGGAQVSEKHAGFLLNRGGTAKDFLDLMAYVSGTVEKQTGIRLEPEVRIVGEDGI